MLDLAKEKKRCVMTKGEEFVLIVFRMIKIFFKIVVLGFLLIGVVGITLFKMITNERELVPQRY